MCVMAVFSSDRARPLLRRKSEIIALTSMAISLVAVRDRWVEKIEQPMDEAMRQTLWEISDKEYAEELYALDKEYIITRKRQ